MSHFVGLCFGDFWQESLEYYNEGIEVDRYIVHTKEEAIDICKKEHAERYEKALEILSDPKISEEVKKYSKQITERGLFLSWDDAWKEVKEWGYKLDEEENLTSTYNPNSKWDWYVIGGRWDGYLILKETDDSNEHITSNQAYASEIDWDLMLNNNHIPYCFVDDNGYWNEVGQMGWCGISYNEKDKDVWKQEFKNYISSIPDYLVTAVDFHI